MEFIKQNIWQLAVFFLSGGMLLWPYLQTRGRKLTTLQATQLINQGKTVILDVREPAEFANGHVRDAINIPLKDLPQRLGDLEKSKSKSIIVVCNVGIQSAKAAAQLQKAGFQDVYSLSGGLTAWQGQGLPVSK
jgi:rhodanese-related sulfurtransferase